MQKVLIIFSSFLLLLWVPSCKKPGTPGPAKFTGCRISEIAESGSDTSLKTVYRVYYNDDGTVHNLFVYVMQAPYTNYYRYFNYSSGRIQTRTVNAQQTYSDQGDTILLDAQNRIVSIRHSYYYYSYNQQWDDYFYDSTGNMYLHNGSGYSNVLTDYVSWQNGDPVVDSQETNGGQLNMTYYTYNDTLYNTGNLTAALSDLEAYGRGIYTPRHLLTQAHVVTPFDDSVKTYRYTLDTGGRISTVTESILGHVTNIRRVGYECQ